MRKVQKRFALHAGKANFLGKMRERGDFTCRMSSHGGGNVRGEISGGRFTAEKVYRRYNREPGDGTGVRQ